MKFAFADHLSGELQMGKAAEHLVCADLILQGHSAFLADQGLPYDVAVDVAGRIYRVQVRACARATTIQGHPRIYPFGTRRAKGAVRAARAALVDFYAFVAIDVRRIAYFPIATLTAKDGLSVIQGVRLRTRQGSIGVAPARGGKNPVRCFEDYAVFECAP